MDTVSKAERSRIMAGVRSRGNRTTELQMEALLKGIGLKGYRKQWHVDGTPDFAWPRLKVALFVDGCFWHGCTNCKKPPASNIEYWKDKIRSNRQRDCRVNRKLRRRRWSVLRVRECAIHLPATLKRIARKIAERQQEGLQKIRPASDT
jgi:DNA mismatch endonuclease (patch repair protein)